MSTDRWLPRKAAVEALNARGWPKHNDGRILTLDVFNRAIARLVEKPTRALSEKDRARFRRKDPKFGVYVYDINILTEWMKNRPRPGNWGHGSYGPRKPKGGEDK